MALARDGSGAGSGGRGMKSNLSLVLSCSLSAECRVAHVGSRADGSKRLATLGTCLMRRIKKKEPSLPDLTPFGLCPRSLSPPNHDHDSISPLYKSMEVRSNLLPS